LRRKKYNYPVIKNKRINNLTHVVDIKNVFFNSITNVFSIYKSNIIDSNLHYFFSISLYKHYIFVLKDLKFFYIKDYFLLRYKTFIYNFFSNNVVLMRSNNFFNYKEFFYFFSYFYKKESFFSNKLNIIGNKIYNKLYLQKKKIYI
jgi:hypothetical protein